MANELTPANLTTALSFGKKFDNYEANLERQTELTKELNLQESKINDFIRKYSADTLTAGTYPSSVSPYIGVTASSFTNLVSNAIPQAGFPPVYTIKVFKKVAENEEFENFSHLRFDSNSALRELDIFDKRFPGLTDYVREIETYFKDKNAPKEDEDATKRLQEEYRELLGRYDKIKADLQEVGDKIKNLERYVDTADKVARIAKHASTKEE